MFEWVFITGLTVCLDSVAARCQLTADFLAGESATAVTLFHYQPTIDMVPARHELRGRLTISEMPLFNAVTGRNAGVGPTASFSVFMVGDRVVPVERGRILRSDNNAPWDLIVDPGWAWTEPDDGGPSRAVLPFTWTGRDYNWSHNGLLVFLYDDQQVVSAFAQVSQENALGSRTDFTARPRLDYLPGQLDVMTATEAYLRTVAVLPPERPLEAVADDLPEALVGHLTDAALSAAAVYRDGVIYRSQCPTQRGQHPWCRVQRHGAYSVSKSLAGAMTLFWLAEEYGDWVLDERIADHVTVTANHDGWRDVRFRDVISMATGIGTNSPNPATRDFYADENDPRIGVYFRATTRSAKLAAAFSYGNYAWGPDEIPRYNTALTFVLSAAIDGLVRQLEGPAVDYWDRLNERVFARVGLGYIDIQRTREADDSRGLPYLGTGLFLTIDETALLSALIAAEGTWQGEQLLHRPSIRGGLYRDQVGQLQRGVTRPDGESRYHFSFFSEPLLTTDGCHDEVPYMVGYGGNIVALGDDGTVVMTYSDGGGYNHRAQAELLGRLGAMCGD